MKSTSTSATKSACASKVRFDEWHTDSWDSALKRIRRLGGLHSFKSVLFKQAFEQPHYPCEFMILSVKGKLKGAMTYWFEEWNETYKVGPIWHIGDFDTAKGTSGMGQCCPFIFSAAGSYRTIQDGVIRRNTYLRTNRIQPGSRILYSLPYRMWIGEPPAPATSFSSHK